MAKEYLLSEKGNDYRANLHCHTTLSDGKVSPERIKELHIEKGYSIVAYTDHDVFIPHHKELSDENFLALNAFEAEFIDLNEIRRKRRTTHLCLIALDENIVNQPCFHRTEFLYYAPESSRDMVKYDENEPDFNRDYNPETVREFMRKCKEKGFFITYNHPAWSLETFEQYGTYEEMDALEIINGGCDIYDGMHDFNHRDYELFLRQGKRIFAVAGDDTHRAEGIGFGWTVIRAPKLTYKDVCDSLKNGNFYATSGPEIKSLYIEDGVVHVETSEAKSIYFNTAVRHAKKIFNEDGTAVNSGSFELNYEEDEYIRVTVIGMDGSICYSNAYFLDK